MEYNEKITRFVGHFSEQQKLIKEVSDLMYRKILYFAALDPLARVVYNGNCTHRERTLHLIENVMKWEYSKKVSLPILKIYLSKKGCLEGELEQQVNIEIDKIKNKEDLFAASPGDCIFSKLTLSKKEQQCLNHAMYSGLIYTYRNSLVHEFREPGYPIEDPEGDVDAPYYLPMQRNEKTEYQLIFPVLFFHNFLKCALKSVKQYLCTKQIDPYSKFDFEFQWPWR